MTQIAKPRTGHDNDSYIPLAKHTKTKKHNAVACVSVDSRLQDETQNTRNVPRKNYNLKIQLEKI